MEYMTVDVYDDEGTMTQWGVTMEVDQMTGDLLHHEWDSVANTRYSYTGNDTWASSFGYVARPHDEDA